MEVVAADCHDVQNVNDTGHDEGGDHRDRAPASRCEQAAHEGHIARRTRATARGSTASTDG